MAEQNSLNINSTTPLVPSKGGLGVSSPTIHGIVVAQGSSAINTKVLTNGQILIGSTGNDPVSSTISAGNGVSILNGSGTITVSATVDSASTIPITFLMMGA